MPPGARPLQREDEAALDELLLTAPAVNLFLLGVLAKVPLDQQLWIGLGDPLRATALVVAGRLMVPFAPDPDDARLLGHWLRRNGHAPGLLVGPRQAVDQVWEVWGGAGASCRRLHDQRLYELASPPPAAERPAGLRRAHEREVAALVAFDQAMNQEDLGQSLNTPQELQRLVQERVREGRTWVVEQGGVLQFQVHVGTRCAYGAQIGGTYVPPNLRGQGLAGRATAEVCRDLLRRFPLVTLHVNEANLAAVRTYERVGFLPTVPFRLLIA